MHSMLMSEDTWTMPLTALPYPETVNDRPVNEAPACDVPAVRALVVEALVQRPKRRSPSLASGDKGSRLSTPQIAALQYLWGAYEAEGCKVHSNMGAQLASLGSGSSASGSDIARWMGSHWMRFPRGTHSDAHYDMRDPRRNGTTIARHPATITHGDMLRARAAIARLRSPLDVVLFRLHGPRNRVTRGDVFGEHACIAELTATVYQRAVQSEQARVRDAHARVVAYWEPRIGPEEARAKADLRGVPARPIGSEDTAAALRAIVEKKDAETIRAVKRAAVELQARAEGEYLGLYGASA